MSTGETQDEKDRENKRECEPEADTRRPQATNRWGRSWSRSSRVSATESGRR